jgi:serine phosphatase RsbU (regulator of sigma subunit)
MALAMIAVILAVGLLMPVSQHLGSLLVVVPAATAALAGPRTTAAVAVLSAGGCVLLDRRDELLGTSTFVVHMLAILLVSALVIVFRNVRERRDKELIEVRAVSETVQRVLLRPLPARVGSLHIGSVYHASHPYALVGGDLYAAARTPGGVRVMIGDVKGKGLPAIEDAAALLGAFREVPHAGLTLPALMVHLETRVLRHFAQRAACDESSLERFITALVLEIPDGGGPVRMVSCGHPPPYMISPSGVVALVPLGEPSPPLGLGTLRAPDYPEDTFPLVPGATLLLYTDGAVEARDGQGRFYDLGARLAAWAGSDQDDLLRYVLDGLAGHVGGAMRLDDDIALVTLRSSGDGPAPADRSATALHAPSP